MHPPCIKISMTKMVVMKTIMMVMMMMSWWWWSFLYSMMWLTPVVNFIDQIHLHFLRWCDDHLMMMMSWLWSSDDSGDHVMTMWWVWWAWRSNSMMWLIPLIIFIDQIPPLINLHRNLRPILSTVMLMMMVMLVMIRVLMTIMMLTTIMMVLMMAIMINE